MGESEAPGESGPRRSGSLFDPVAGMRALADVQAEGLRAAGELLERMLRSEPDSSDSRSGSPAGGYTALVEAWSDLLRRTVAGPPQPGHPGAVSVPVDSSGIGPLVRLELSGSGSADGVAVEVWLHNGTHSAVGPLALRCGELSDSGGAVLDSTDVRFEPPEVALLPPRSSQAVAVSLAATGPLRPGTYRGTIQASGAPAVWLPLEVVIT